MNNSKNQTSAKPQHRATKIIMLISLILNALLIGCAILSNMVSDAFVSVLTDEDIIAAKGLQIICSEEYRERKQKGYEKPGNMTDNEVKHAMAYIDFLCQQNNAENFFNEGLDKYRASLGIPSDEELFLESLSSHNDQ